MATVINATHVPVSVLQAVDEEVGSARGKFPSPRHNMVALVEEVGELAKALLETTERASLVLPTRLDGAVRKECIQVAAMALRVLLEGDPDHSEYQPAS